VTLGKIDKSQVGEMTHTQEGWTAILRSTERRFLINKFWSNQDRIYNYKAELTGIGSRSFINNLDY